MKNKNKFITYSILLILCLITCTPRTIFSQNIGLEVAPVHDVLFGESLEGEGIKLIWSPAKGALRAGTVSAEFWDPDSLGSYSVSFGTNNLVTGEGGMSWGSSNKVPVILASTWGLRNMATGANSTVWGEENIAASRSETIFGMYANVSTPTNPFSLSGNDQLLAIGNGTSDSDRQNALTVLKNGNVYLTDDTNGDGGVSTNLYVPGHIFIAPFNNSNNISYLQARRENSSGSTQLNIRTTQNGVISEAVQIKSDGDVDIKGFVKIGQGAPSVKMVELIGSTSTTNATTTISLPSGVSADKILTLNAVLSAGNGYIMPNGTSTNGYEYAVIWASNVVFIEASATNGGNVAGNPIKVTIFYKE